MSSGLRGLAPGFYYEELSHGRMMVVEIFKDWLPPDKPDGNRVSGWYKNIFNSHDEAVKHMVKRGCKVKEGAIPIEINPNHSHCSQEVEMEH